MSKLMENVKTLNSVIRTGVFACLMGGLGYGGYVGYYEYVKPGIDAKEALAELDQLRTDFKLKSEELSQTLEENDKLKTSNRLLKIDRRVANIEILDVTENEQGEPTMHVRCNIDWKWTVGRNLKNFNKELGVLIPERVYFYSRAQRTNNWTVIIDMDQSGSMADSVVYGAVVGSIFASLPALETRVVAFDTDVVDLTEQCGDDPVDMLFGVPTRWRDGHQ